VGAGVKVARDRVEERVPGRERATSDVLAVALLLLHARHRPLDGVAATRAADVHQSADLARAQAPLDGEGENGRLIRAGRRAGAR